MCLMYRIIVFFCLLSFSSEGQHYRFNTKEDAVFYTSFVNTLYCEQGTPLCFDGTIKISTTDSIGFYLIEVLDTVTRAQGMLNLAAYIQTPEGGKEKIFIDKFTFKINKGPKPILFFGAVSGGSQIDTTNLNIEVGFIETAPLPNYQITEIQLLFNQKEAITVKGNQLTNSLKDKIKRLSQGTEVGVSVVYKDPLQRLKRISAIYFL